MGFELNIRILSHLGNGPDHAMGILTFVSLGWVFISFENAQQEVDHCFVAAPILVTCDAQPADSPWLSSAQNPLSVRYRERES